MTSAADLPTEFHARLTRIVTDQVATLTGDRRALWDNAIWKVDGWKMTVAADQDHAFVTAVRPDGSEADILRVALDADGLPHPGGPPGPS